MTDVVTPWWQAVDEAVEALVAALTVAAARATAQSGRKQARRGPRPKRRTKSTRRHLADVIRAQRLAPGRAVDRNMIAALFNGHRELITDPDLVVAVARACGIVSGRKSTRKELDRLRAASRRIAKLIARAEDADRSAGVVAAPPPALGAIIPAQPVPAPPLPSSVALQHPGGERKPGRKLRRARRRRLAAIVAIAVLVLLAALLLWLT